MKWLQLYRCSVPLIPMKAFSIQLIQPLDCNKLTWPHLSSIRQLIYHLLSSYDNKIWGKAVTTFHCLSLQITATISNCWWNNFLFKKY